MEVQGLFSVVAHITQEHNVLFVGLAAVVCLVGSYLSVMLALRALRGKGRRQSVQLFLFGLIGGATIWSTHFIAMLAYDPGVPHAFGTGLTILSLAVAVVGVMVTLWPLARRITMPRVLMSGAGFGLVVSAMHYIGMMAYLVPGVVVWNMSYVVGSVVLGALISAAAFHRVAHPVTRWCWLGGQLLLVLAICTMHFTGMTAVSIELSPLETVPEQAIPDAILGALVFGVTAVVFAVGFATISIESQLERESLVRLTHTVNHDQLTGLPNRMKLSALMDALAERANPPARVAVLAIDLDGFKQVNDLHGHAAGDAVLVELSARFQSVCRLGEMIARTGGDEFVAIKEDPISLEAALDFAHRLVAVTKDPVDVARMSLSIGLSVGVATSISEDIAPSALQQQADLAMYRAKLRPDQSVCAYDADMDREYRMRLQMTEDLSFAAERGELFLAYQLQNDTNSGQPIGCEALLRWQHPKHGVVRPDDFIPLAEETGLIRPIGQWVLQTACAEAATWPVPLAIAVNVAPQQLMQADFVARLREVLDQTGLAPARLELEVTEASIFEDMAFTMNVIDEVRALGVRIAMDDFGTGYSSLATLRSFPFDKIKIDKSFIRDVHLDEQRAAIVRAVLLLGASLNMPVLAEGVETDSELGFLRDHACSSVQGFLYGKPLSTQELREWMADQQVDRAS